MNEEIIINNNNIYCGGLLIEQREQLFIVWLFIYTIYSVIYLAYKHTKAHAETHVSN